MLAEQGCYVFLLYELKSLVAVYYFEQEQTHILDPQYYMWHVQAVYRKIVCAVCSEQLSITRETESSVVSYAAYVFSQKKYSAHERAWESVTSGEWASGKKWADDAPREMMDADSVSLMSSGSCGAFVHGLEDEYQGVCWCCCLWDVLTLTAPVKLYLLFRKGLIYFLKKCE